MKHRPAVLDLIQDPDPLETELWINALADRITKGIVLRAGLSDLVEQLLPLSQVRAKA